MLYTMDAGLGNITQELKAQRMWAQTLMVVTVRGHSNHKACKNILAAVVIEVLLLIIWAVWDGTPHTAPVCSELQ